MASLIHQIDLTLIGDSEDWEGNNAAFTCPICGKVFLVSGLLHDGVRACPKCGKSEAHVDGGKKSGGKAYVVFNEDDKP